MPGFDGTGPLGQGPLTGGGRGFCVMPLNNNTRISYGTAGLQNYPANIPYSNPQGPNSFLNPSYQYLPYQLGSFGSFGRLTGYFRVKGGRSFLRGKGVRGRGRGF